MSSIPLLPGLSFDVRDLLSGSLPVFYPSTVAITVPEGLSPASLRDSPVGKELVHQQTWYDTYPWTTQPIAPGVYQLRLPIPDSNRKTFDERKKLLLPGEEAAPLVLVELAMLCLNKAGHTDPLKGGRVRCPESTGRYRIGLSWYDGRLYIHDIWAGGRYGSVWLAGVRRAP